LGLFHWGNQWRQISIGNEHSKLSSAPRRQPNHPSNTAGSYLYNNGSPLPNRRIGLSGATARSSLRTRSHTDLRQLSQQQCQQQVQPKDIRAARLGYVDKTAALKALAQYVEVPNTKLAGRYPLPNLVEIIESLMENTSPPMRVSRKTLLDIYRQSKNRAAALDNPHEFATVAVGFIKARLADQLVDGIRYEKIDQWYEMTQFQAEIESWADYIVPSTAKNGAGGTHIYDGVPFEKAQGREALHQATVLVHGRDANRRIQSRLGNRDGEPRGRGGFVISRA
jgi:hypothetical protein